MADQNLGVLYTPIEARLQPLEQGIKRAEGIAREGAKKIEKASQVNIGQQRGGLPGGGMGGSSFFDTSFQLAAGIQAAATAFGAANVAANLFSGNMKEAQQALFAMPLGIGQVARAFDQLMDTIEGPLQGLTDIEFKQIEIAKKSREMIRERATDRRRALGGELGGLGLEGSDAERQQVNAERQKRLTQLAKEQREAFKSNIDLRKEFAAEREQIEEISRRKLEAIDRKEAEQKEKAAALQLEKERKVAEDALKIQQQQAEQFTQLRDQNDIEALRKTDMMAAEKLQIEKDAETAIRRATAEGNTALIPEIERQRALRLAGVSAGGRAEQIEDLSRMVLGGAAGLNRGADEKPAWKKQADTQIGVLRDMLSAITRLQFEATAN